MVVSCIIPVLVPVTALFLSRIYDVLIDGQWRVPLPPPIGSHKSKLAAPKPDVTVGYKWSDLGFFNAIDELSPYSEPVICRPQLVFPAFTLEAKGLMCTHYAVLQNKHNCAHMLHALEKLRSRANQPGWQQQFYGHATVVSVLLSRDIVSLHIHWVEREKERTAFYSRPIKSWMAQHEDYHEMSKCVVNAISTTLMSNREWIVSELRKIEESLAGPMSATLTAPANKRSISEMSPGPATKRDHVEH